MRKPTVDWLAGLAAVGAQWRACTAATRRRSRVGLVSGGSAWATSALCKLCMMGPVLMLHGLVLLLADGTVPEPPGMARVTGGELNLKYTPESGMLLAGSQWCAGAAPDSKLLESVAPHVNATELASHETTGSGRARPRQPRKGVAASDRRAEVFRAVREPSGDQRINAQLDVARTNGELFDGKKLKVIVRAIKPIAPEEEILVCYGSGFARAGYVSSCDCQRCQACSA